MLREIFEENILSVPWPLYVGETFFEGTKVTKSASCNIDCLSETKFKKIHKCAHGLSHVSKNIDGHHIVVSGVYIDSMSTRVRS